MNIIRIFPYSAAQLAANDGYKQFLADDKHELTVRPAHEERCQLGSWVARKQDVAAEVVEDDTTGC